MDLGVCVSAASVMHTPLLIVQWRCSLSGPLYLTGCETEIKTRTHTHLSSEGDPVLKVQAHDFSVIRVGDIENFPRRTLYILV